MILKPTLSSGNVRSCIPVGIRIEPLAAHAEVLPLLQRWFEMEWPSYYGKDGPGNAQRDLQVLANRGSLPMGLVAFCGDRLCGVAALKAESIASHRHLSPWAAAGLVKPSERGRGIGTQLLAGLEREACRLGFQRLYCATNTAESLLHRRGWKLMELIVHEGVDLGIFCKEF
ncbi:MAG: GNAT family N-acetyltransferase [Desulfosarcina sp.]